MKDITYYNKRCAELIGKSFDDYKGRYPFWEFIVDGKTEMFYKEAVNEIPFIKSFSWQITVWQKVYAVVLDNISGIEDITRFTKIREQYFHEIDLGTPETAFTILCQAIDFIDANGKEKEK